MSVELSMEAQRIASEKPEFWEYRLSVEVLQTEMKAVLQRWDALKRGLYSLPRYRVGEHDGVYWIRDRLSEAGNFSTSFGGLINQEFGRAWGPPGEPGDADAIIATSRLYAEMCAGALAWEERVRFASLDLVLEPVRELLVGVVGVLLDEAAKLPRFLADIFSDDNPSGRFRLEMELNLPEGWLEKINRATQEATDQIIADMQDYE